MGTAGQHIAWTTPRACCGSCDLCEHSDDQVTILPATPARPVQREPVRQVHPQDTAEIVFGGELPVY